jgi:hypothetical protein
MLRASLFLLASTRSIGSRITSPAPLPVVLRPCAYAGPQVVPSQRFTFDASTSTFALQDGSNRCLSLSACTGGAGDVAAVSTCHPGGDPCQAWTTTAGDSSPPNALRTELTGRCLDVNSAHNPDAIDVWDCAISPDQWKNQEWFFNASSGSITSLDTDPSCTNLCLTPSAAPAIKIGTYDYFVDESSPIIFNGALLMFESIVKASPQWAGNWIPAFIDCESYFRVRDMHTLAVIVNLTASCNHAFGAATVFTNQVSGLETLLVSGTPWSRANVATPAFHERSSRVDSGWSGPCQSASNCTVDLFWSTDPTLIDSSWSSAVPGIHTPGIGVYNNDITAVPSSAGVPFRWAMALETTQETARFAVSSSDDPTNTSAWALLNATFTLPALPDVGSCPSLRHDGTYFYYLTGGSNIQILRSLDLATWAESQRHVLQHDDPGDCIIAPAWFGAPSGYVPTAAAEAHLLTCGPAGNFGDGARLCGRT